MRLETMRWSPNLQALMERALMPDLEITIVQRSSGVRQQGPFAR
jgi:hypothetical protein